MSNAPLLVRTPEQLVGESLLGFVLRASEENGYETPWRLFQFAGIEQRGMLTSGLDVTQLARAFGRSAASLCGYSHENASGNSVTSLAGHTVAPRHLRLDAPQLCPACVSEHGHIPAWMDLALVDACPFHERRLIHTCPACGQCLSWFRPGLLVCRCGFDLTGARGEPIGPAHGGLLSVIAAKVAGSPMHPGNENLPVQHLQSMSLRGLLRLLDILGRFGRAASPNMGESVAAIAATILSDWPRNFHDMLRALGPRELGTTTGLRKQFEQLYAPLFKGKTVKAEVMFVRDAFIEFGRSHWGLAQVDAKLLGTHAADEPARFLSLTQTAAAMGVRRTTARSYLERNIRIARVTGQEAKRRYVIDASLVVPRKVEGQSYGAREAARRLHIPVSVFQALRRSGHIEAYRLGSRFKTIHAADLSDFEAKVAALAIGPFQPCTDPMSVREALRLKFKSKDGKAQMVAAALDGRLRILGALGGNLDDLLVDRRAVMAFIDGIRAAAYDEALTPREASARLHCDSLVIPELARMGRLEGRTVAAGLRVSVASVQRFSKEYRSVAELAKECNTSSRKLTNDFRRSGIPLLEIERGYGRGPQPFVPRASLKSARLS